MSLLCVLNNEYNSLNVYVDQINMVDSYSIGFANFIGSRKSLEDVRDYIVNPSYDKYMRIHYYDVENEEILDRSFLLLQCSAYSAGKCKFIFRKIEDSQYWQLTVINVDVYYSCQDFVRGIKLDERERKAESEGRPIDKDLYFLLRMTDLFPDKREMERYLMLNKNDMKYALYCNTIFQDLICKKISMISSIPILREWIPQLLRYRDERSMNFADISDSCLDKIEYSPYCQNKMITLKVRFYPYRLRAAIEKAFSSGDIHTGNNEVRSGKVNDAGSLTGYLSIFSDDLIHRAHERFEPLFVPGISEVPKKADYLFNYAKYYGHFNYFAAQRDVICSVASGLQKNKRTLIVGECGIGKTGIALGSILVHSKKKNPVTVIMCPGHMVEEWKKEVRRLYPFSKAVIVENLIQLREYENDIKAKSLKYPLFLILGKDSCKTDYEERPWAHWNTRDRRYEIFNRELSFYNHYSYYARTRGEYLEYITECMLLFLKKGKKNTYHSAPKKSNMGDGVYETNYSIVEINSYMSSGKKGSLWTAARDGNNAEWVKVPKSGWVNIFLARQLKDLVDDKIAAGKDDELSDNVLKAYEIASSALQQDVAKPIIKCNISQYIRRRFKHLIDYFIADEVHLYSSKTSAQGKAFSNIINASKHTIALTGTLLNGYAEDVFSMLFKLYSRTFVRNGFGYSDVKEFAKEYGVVDTIREYRVNNNTGWSYQISSKTKYKPGVSPLLFSKFLLDKAVFVTLSDITADLPNYHEIPTGVDMDIETRTGYNRFMDGFKQSIRDHAGCTHKFLFKMIHRLNTYPDQPYNQVPIFDNDTGEQILIPPSIHRDTSKPFMSAKDEKVLELVNQHKANGEKVLIYVSWINKMDCVQRLQEILESYNIKTAFLTASVSARNRQAWIAQKLKEGIDVLICNPKLVETGLNLLDFTTIIFYQLDYNLFTMRQASRRSLRLNQSKDVNVYFLYFKETMQESVIALMANKLQAAMAIEGKFSEEGLNAMGDTDSILTQLANNLTKDIDMKLSSGTFDFHTIKAQTSGNRFKAITDTFMEDWFFKTKKKTRKGKKYLEPIDISEDIKLLNVG